MLSIRSRIDRSMSSSLVCMSASDWLDFLTPLSARRSFMCLSALRNLSVTESCFDSCIATSSASFAQVASTPWMRGPDSSSKRPSRRPIRWAISSVHALMLTQLSCRSRKMVSKPGASCQPIASSVPVSECSFPRTSVPHGASILPVAFFLAISRTFPAKSEPAEARRWDSSWAASSTLPKLLALSAILRSSFTAASNSRADSTCSSAFVLM
mmetsp:Transcript_65693/g.182864  ORF Transcript_65693/g.182864 Transcript_65693/m.182864 type:complete len:212 (-) Transcript_65693:873-1508(-)